MIIKNKQRVGFFCKHCRSHGTKTAKYMLRRIKEGKSEFYCSRSCADIAHSTTMSGTNNPNYNGRWNGPDPKTILTTEQRSEIALRYIAIQKENGTFDDMMQKVHEGHKRFFSTEKGKQTRQAMGVKGYLACVNNKNKRTSIEVKMAEELSRRGIEYVEQYNLGNKFALDFFLPEYQIVIECDGDYWHRLPKSIARDKSKNAYVKACGFSMYRFWESEINADVESCVDVVLAEINEMEAI